MHVVEDGAVGNIVEIGHADVGLLDLLVVEFWDEGFGLNSIGIASVIDFTKSG